MRLLLIVCLLIITQSQIFQMFPNSSYNELTASSRACFANCQFCQIKTGFCEECLSPYFQKDVNGNCVLIKGYIIQSSVQEVTSGSGFLPSNVSWSNTKTTTCVPGQDYFTNTMKVLGPFTASSGVITYQRSVSSHKYMKLKFFLLKINWAQNDSLRIIIRDQTNALLSNQTISYTNAPKETICSQTPLDQRYSLSFDFENPASTSLFISFSPKFANPSTAWAISTFLLLTGSCNQTCDDCFGSLQGTKCKSCRNFLIQGVDGTCSNCPDGFRRVVMNGVQRCEKCSIEYKSCELTNEVCFYSNLSTQLNSANCKWDDKQNYVSQYQADTLQFTGSLFSVNGASSIYKCGDYSMIGLAGRSQPITRIFTNLKAHQSLSMTFNIMIVDQIATQKTTFEIFIDNVRVENLFINTVGISSICGGPDKEVFQTYPATKFFQHNNTQNVNITIRSSNAANWGIRNFRLSLHVCDESCLECGPNGCLTCSSYYALEQLSCSACPKGSSPSVFDSNFCYECSDYCLSCIVTKNDSQMVKACTKCQQGFYVFEGHCEAISNIDQMIQLETVDWKSTNPLLGEDQCKLRFKINPSDNYRVINFLVGQNNLMSTYSIPEPHFRFLVSFYVIKIDTWAPTDELHFYLNDLLVLKKTYGQFGNRICYQKNQTDVASYEQIRYDDDNQTITAYFQVVSSVPDVKRKFGISHFTIIPVGCPECQNYNFQYKVEYNYDEVLTVQVIFNRLYINYDPDLFKTIFVLEVNGKKLDYELVKNDSIRYILHAHPDSEVLLSNITVFCKYPQKVVTDISNPINQAPFFKSRIMQTSASYVKSLSNSVSSVTIDRFTPLDSVGSSDGVRIFFEVVTRAVVYLGFFSFFIGCLTPCTHFMHNVQKIWLHIYVASLTMPNFLKFALRGFRQSQDQNIAINPTQWQIGIPQHLYYEAPAQYQDYYHDITFFRNIYNIGFAVALYLTFAAIVYLIFKLKKAGRESNNKFLRHMKITFYRRPFFVLNSVIFYQYITTCIACTLQFIDLSSNTNQSTFKGINAAATVICFVLATVYPIVHFFYLSYKQNDMYSIDYQVSYRNRYHEIFYRFLPKDIWKIPNFDFVPIGFKQRFYNLLRFGEIWWISIIFALMSGAPFAQAFLLMVTNFLHLAFLWVSSISTNRTFKFLKVLELMFFVGLEIIILVAYQQNQTLTKDAFKALGVVGVAFIFVILGLSLIRFVYTLYKLIREYQDYHSKNNKKDQRLRNDDFFQSFENPNQKIISEE